MDTYSFLRELADSWVLLIMFSFFTGVALWAFWPGLHHARDEARMIPFRNDGAPNRCAGTCGSCACGGQAKGKTDV